MTADEFATVFREKLAHLDDTAIGCARRAVPPGTRFGQHFVCTSRRSGGQPEICRALGLEFDIEAPAWELVATEP